MKRNPVEKPDDMADETVLSGDGINPVSRHDEHPVPDDTLENGINIAFPGAIPPAYFPGFPGGPSIG